MTSFNGWGTAWGGSWGPTGIDPNALAGSASFSITATGLLTAVSNNAAGKGSTLADHEAEWALKRAHEAIEKAQGESSQVRRRVRRQAAREVYFQPLPDVAQQYVDGLKAKVEAARVVEIRALMDLGDESRVIRQEIAQAAVALAKARRLEAERAIEEFDVMYVATILASA